MLSHWVSKIKNILKSEKILKLVIYHEILRGTLNFKNPNSQLKKPLSNRSPEGHKLATNDGEITFIDSLCGEVLQI